MESLLLLQLHPSSGLVPHRYGEVIYALASLPFNLPSFSLAFLCLRASSSPHNHGASKGIRGALTCRFRANFTPIEQQSTTPLLLSAVFR
jgi:hypothetical protein